MSQSLKGLSLLAAKIWRHLLQAQTLEEEVEILNQLWQVQDDRVAAIDAHAELADQIDAEIAAVKARMEHLVSIHAKELARLTRWRESLDTTILHLNESGVVSSEVAGRSRRIRIKLNPPACEILNLNEVPPDYITVKVVEERKPDKTKIKAAWSKGTPVPGTHVERKRRIVYEIAPTSLEQIKGEVQSAAKHSRR
ncbi:hypothetical protein C7B80_03240 [Cyanosarcina cf. burmensis CCALA 770]|nr:hypothetical protein C7B80_03240 [Cyanosarcina cf. burmensis CCALA 770]